MSIVTDLATMCLGSALIAFFVMLLAGNIGRLLRHVASNEDE